GDAFTTLEADEHREHVSDHGSEPAVEREQRHLGYVRAEQPHRHGTFRGVEQPHWNRVLPPEDPVDVGGAKVPASLLSEVDSLEHAARDEARGNRASEVGQNQPADGRHHLRFALRAVNLRRSGEPLKRQAVRNPCDRYRWYDSGTSSGRFVTMANVGGAVPICEA